MNKSGLLDMSFKMGYNPFLDDGSEYIKIKEKKMKENLEKDWTKLAEIADPNKWMQIYDDYLNLITQQDTILWWQEQFDIANADRCDLQDQIKNLKDLISKLRKVLDEEEFQGE